MTTPARTVLAGLLACLLVTALPAQVIFSEQFNTMPNGQPPVGWETRGDTAATISADGPFDTTAYLAFNYGQAGGDVATPIIDLSSYLFAGSTAVVTVDFVYKAASTTNDGDGLLIGVGDAYNNVLWIFGSAVATGSYNQGVPTYDRAWHAGSFTLNATQDFWSFNGGFLDPTKFRIGMENWVGANGWGNGGGGLPDVGIDNLSVSAVPEPSTYAALAGAAALGFVAWRRRRTA